jgi:hypothetical protein
MSNITLEKPLYLSDVFIYREEKRQSILKIHKTNIKRKRSKRKDKVAFDMLPRKRRKSKEKMRRRMTFRTSSINKEKFIFIEEEDKETNDQMIKQIVQKGEFYLFRCTKSIFSST